MFIHRLGKRMRINNSVMRHEKQIEPPRISLFQKLIKFSEYFLGIGVLLYVLGFIIENVFLGSFGVTIFDILKARYILIGFLFALFLFAVGIPTWDIIGFYGSSNKIPFYKAIIRLFKNAFLLFVTLYFIGSVLEILASPKDTFPLGIANINPIHPFSLWISKVFPDMILKWLQTTAVFGLVVIGFLVIVLVVMFFINPKIGNERYSRMDFLREFFSNVKKLGFSPIFDFIGILFLYFFLLPMVTSLIVFLTTNKISAGSAITPTLSIDFSSVYFRFLIAVVLCFMALSIVLLSIQFRGKTISDRNNSTPRLFNQIIGWSYLLAIVIVFLIPIYSYGVFPLIPQQIGGGKAVQVEIITNNSEVQVKLQPPNCEPYLIDRTSNSILVLCDNPTSIEFNIIEVQLDQIEMIIFQNDHGS